MESDTEHSRHGNKLVDILSSRIRPHDNDVRNELGLNVLLLGDKQSGRSSVGNALIGGHEFPTGTRILGDSVTTEYHILRRNYPRYFRRQGAECDLLLRVIDTPPLVSHPGSVHKLCPDGVHVLVLVVRADLAHKAVHVEQHVASLFGPEWRRHALLVLTYADKVKEAGLDASSYLSGTTDWLRALAEQVKGGVVFLDNSGDWPSIAGEPLRDRLLRLSASNHHGSLKVRTEA